MTVSTAANAHARLIALTATARARARATGSGVLVSVAQRTAMADPLDSLQRLVDRSVPGAVGEAAAHRMYWTRPADDFALAGFGSVVAFSPDGADRFATVDRQWSALRESALVDDPSAETVGVGPLLMGGFAFEPGGPRTDRWHGFPAASLVVPRLQLSVTGDDHWLTLSVLVAPNGECDLDPAVLAALVERLDAPPAAVAQRTANGVPPAALAFCEPEPGLAWRASVGDAIAAIQGGSFEKVVLAREVRATAARDFDVTAAVRQLRSAHTASMTFACWHGDRAFVGASPELLVRTEGREVRASSLAGSVSRGATADDDAALVAVLLASAKDRTEHEVVRRAICDALEQLCDRVVAGRAPSLLSLPQMHHLHTDIRAHLRDGHSLLDLVAQLHPTPAVGGAPRTPALEFLRAHEALDRGWYAAPIGWLQRGRGEFAVALRCALIRGSEASLYAGSGIVADSDPDAEYAESQLKLRPMQAALAASVAAPRDSGSARASSGGRTGA